MTRDRAVIVSFNGKHVWTAISQSDRGSRADVELPN